MQMRSHLQRLFPSLLCAFSVAFPYCFAGTLDIWVGNRSEFLFSPGDFAGGAALCMLGVWVLLTAVLVLLPERIYPVAFGLFAWFGIMSCVQGMFLNYGMRSLLEDDGGTQASPTWFVVLDTVLWIAAGVGCVVGALKMKKKEMVRTVAIILLVTVCGMQLVGCVSLVPKLFAPGTETATETGTGGTEPSESGTAGAETASGRTDNAGTETGTGTAGGEPDKLYLTNAGLNTVAPGKNIVIFVLDRFDTLYYDELLAEDPDVFSFLTGFTAYPDNISLYSRTYPGVTSMISGMRNDFSGSAEQYFATAYGQSDFLRTLRENDYAVRIYTADYYGYRDAAALAGVANNLNASHGYTVTDRGRLLGNMLALSAYRYLPTVLKPLVSVSTASFTGVGSYGEAPAYELDDADVLATVRGGLSVDSRFGQNAYTFLHLNGCHVSAGSMKSSARRCLEIIRRYLDEMKRLGVYDDATVVITGDHPWAVDDHVEPTQPRLTALFVKEAGAAEKPLRVSTAQVSQENLIPTLVKSAGLRTDRSFGTAYSEVPEGVDTERHHLFELTYGNGYSALVDFRVCGKGRDFANWQVDSRTDIGWLYK